MGELVKRLRELHPEEFGDAWDFAFACQQAMHEAADVIEELMRRCEQCQYMPPPAWIPVTEQLPDADGFTLIFTAHGHAGVCYFTSGWWGGYNEEGITHWMPLPQPPEEE